MFGKPKRRSDYYLARGGLSRVRSSSLKSSKPLKYSETYMSSFDLDNLRPPSKRFINDPCALFEIKEENKASEGKSPDKILKMHKFSESETKEIRTYTEIFFIGNSQKKHNGVYDDEKGYYKTFVGDHIAYRYEILHIVGEGSFGIVVSCFDHKMHSPVAIKILRNGQQFKENGELEVRNLNIISDGGHNDVIIEKLSEFMFRNHFCIVFELLSSDLYQFLKQSQFRGLPIGVLRRITIQLLMGLKHIHHKGLIHCDLKPENILFKVSQKSGVKIIDFGSACPINEKQFTYIQSRFYRAPEVILELEYDEKIDIWSLGCILFELYTGTPLFMGNDEVEQLCRIIETLGEIPVNMLKRSPREELFDDKFRLIQANSVDPGSNRISRQLKKVDSSFVGFLEECLKIDYRQRINAAGALMHPWITGQSGKNGHNGRVFNKSLNIF